MKTSQVQPNGRNAPDGNGAAEPEAVSKRRGRMPGAAGPTIVLLCLIVPIILGILATAGEETTAERAIETQQASSTAVPQPQSTTSSRPRLLDQQYYFVNGCVSAPVDCGKANAGTWGEYYQQLGRMYEEAAAAVAGEEQVSSFDDWATTHVHFISAQTAAEGAHELEQILPQNTAQADIHMIGTSAGGASIFAYLGRALRGDVPLDKRVRSGIAVDSPLGFQFPFRSGDVFLGVQAGAMKSDVAAGVGEWAKAANILLFTVNTPNDIVNHETVPDVRNDPAPVYAEEEDTPPKPVYVNCESVFCSAFNIAERLTLGSTWHIYTGSHMADSTQQFMEEHWR
jgi:hypothetical protein